MQTPKSNLLGVPLGTSPKTPRTAWQIKTPGSGSEPLSSPPNKVSKTNKDRSPKVIERKTPQSPVTKKKHRTKASHSESQVYQLQEELKQAKDKLTSSELFKEQAELEAEEAKKQLSAVTTKLENTEKQLMEISNMEECRVKELCKISQDCDRAWESELEAAQKQHSVYSAELSSALNEIQKLKIQCGDEAESASDQFNSTGSAADEVQHLRSQHGKTVAMIEKLEFEFIDCKKSETKALETLNSTQTQLEAAWEETESLKLANLNAVKKYYTISMDLEESKAKVKALEMLVSKLQSELVTCCDGEDGMKERSAGDTRHCVENEQNEEIVKLKSEIMGFKYEDCKLRAALEAAEMRYQEVRLQSTLEVRGVYEQAESVKLEFKSKEAELEALLKTAYSDIKQLQSKLVDTSTRLQTYAEQELQSNAGNDQKRQLEIQFTALQETLSKKENLLQTIAKGNEILKLDMQKWEMEKRKMADADALAEKVASKFESLTEESDNNSKKTARVIEQLNAAQAANVELESELRKLKVQSDQWRKAAEAAAAMLTSGNNEKYISGQQLSHSWWKDQFSLLRRSK